MYCRWLTWQVTGNRHVTASSGYRTQATIVTCALSARAIFQIWSSESDSLVHGDDTTCNSIRLAYTSHIVSALSSHDPPAMSGSSQSPLLLNDAQNTRQWTCVECSQVFTQSQLLEEHAKETKHGAYRCTRKIGCRKTFDSRTSWTRHQSSHSERKPHVCSGCGKRFHRKDNLRDHARARRACNLASRRVSNPPEPSSDSASGGLCDTPADIANVALYGANSSAAPVVTKSVMPLELGTTLFDDLEVSHTKEAEYGDPQTLNDLHAIHQGNKCRTRDNIHVLDTGRASADADRLAQDHSNHQLFGPIPSQMDTSKARTWSEFDTWWLGGMVSFAGAGGMGIVASTGVGALGLAAITGGLGLLGSASFSRWRRPIQDDKQAATKPT